MAMMSKDDLRKLFTLRNCASDTHEFLKCKRGPPKPKPEEKPAEQEVPPPTEQKGARDARCTGCHCFACVRFLFLFGAACCGFDSSPV